MPDRADADQEGTTLPPREATRMIAYQEAWRAVDKHRADCAFATEQIQNRLRNVEISYGRLIGFLLGAGALGGATGGVTAATIKLITQ